MANGISRRTAFAGLAIGTTLMGTTALAQKAKAKRHPRLTRALQEMRDARTYMEKAPNNFGGHKARAIRALDVAIEELEKAEDLD